MNDVQSDQPVDSIVIDLLEWGPAVIDDCLGENRPFAISGSVNLRHAALISIAPSPASAVT
jgi:hypothetical protein